MRERPILFSAPMVRATIYGSKTQTRRIVKPQPELRGERGNDCVVTIGRQRHSGPTRYMLDRLAEFGCPYGKAGDRMWGRESWQFADWTEDGMPYVRYAADNAVRFCEGAGEGETLVDIWAHLSRVENYSIDNKAADRRWRPSIHMFRWASRILLEITDVRVERLQDISESDAEAEGVDFMRGIPDIDETLTARTLYAGLWDSINGDGSWALNPWVWVVSFKRGA